MTRKPPSGPADHAEDFSLRYAREMDYLTGDKMTELGIPADKIGSRVPGQGHAAFIPRSTPGHGVADQRGRGGRHILRAMRPKERKR